MAGEIRLPELGGGEVHRDATEGEGVPVPAPHVGGDLPDQAIPQGRGELGILEDQPEIAGRHQALGRMLPARQGLEADDGAGPQADLGLIEGHEGAGVDPGADFRDEADAVFGFGAHGRIEHDGAVPPRRLGAVERDIRILEQFEAIAVMVGKRGDPDAGLAGERAAAIAQRRVKPLQQRRCERNRVREPRRLGQEQRELVAAEARHRIPRAETGPEALGDLDEHGIPHVVAQGLVHVLEPVEVDQQQADARPARSASVSAASSCCRKKPRLARPVRPS